MKTIAFLPSLLMAPLAALRAADAPKPNIVFIMADDHGRQAISAYGSKLIQTPQLEKTGSAPNAMGLAR